MTLLQKIVSIVVLGLVISAGVYFGIVRKYNLGGAPDYTTGECVIDYRNNTFGFEICLTAGWEGYTVNHIKEDIRNISDATTKNNGVVDSFQLIELHYPGESISTPHEVMPIMIFTPTQWGHIQKGEWSVGAAPIPPSELGHNSKYIFAIPARYNYDFATGWEEVDQLIHDLQTFEPAISSGISGTILVGPMCPPYRGAENDPACNDRPYQGEFIVKNSSGAVVARFFTDANSVFLIALPEGTYTIEPTNQIGMGQQSRTVQVFPTKITQITLTFDTGIR